MAVSVCLTKFSHGDTVKFYNILENKPIGLTITFNMNNKKWLENYIEYFIKTNWQLGPWL